ncbi:shikimate dehydrogenase [bacterium]|nr:shikimate dehydrogenase [bacterium]
MRPEQLAETLEALNGPNLLGINLTLPLKEAAFQVCTPSQQARAVGAINCLRPGPLGWEGHNTDAQGWLDSFQEELNAEIKGRKALVLGAGGACRAILYVLRSQGAREIVIFNRTPERARALLQPGERLGEHFPDELEANCLVVQTTSLGMWPQTEELPQAWPERLPPGLIACDLIYNPSPTLWLRQAADKGALILDGCGMLVHQAIRAIEWWTGDKPEPQPMLAALKASL